MSWNPNKKDLRFLLTGATFQVTVKAYYFPKQERFFLISKFLRDSS